MAMIKEENQERGELEISREMNASRRKKCPQEMPFKIKMFILSTSLQHSTGVSDWTISQS